MVEQTTSMSKGEGHGRYRKDSEGGPNAKPPTWRGIWSSVTVDCVASRDGLEVEWGLRQLRGGQRHCGRCSNNSLSLL